MFFRHSFLDLLKSVFTLKKVEWSYENEFRFVFLNIYKGEKTKKFITVGKIRPAKLFIGEKMNKANRAKLIKICHAKNIKVYQMYSVIRNNTFLLKSKKID